MSFEPKLIGMLCNWCSYSAADLAGSSKLLYPPNLKVVRVACSGRVDPSFVLEAFARGADGVLICGCHPGDCHYISGNSKALARIQLIQHITTDFGIEPERLRLEWVSAQQAERYVEIVNEMIAGLRALGPLNWPAHKAAAMVGG
jgi:F420-non-reducing hydrogenase iron-sulfur subunit